MSTNDSNIQDLAALASLAKSLLNGKEYLVGSIADRFRKAAAKYPHDQAIRAMQNVFERRLAKEGGLLIVSQQDVQSLYDQVSNLGSAVKFEEELGDLLLETRRVSSAHYNPDYIGSIRDSGSTMEISDTEVVSELEELFSAPGTKVAKSKFLESGRKGVLMELVSMGFSSPTVEVAARDDYFVIYAAQITTRRGSVPFLVPAEIKLGNVLLPSVFISNNEFLELNAGNIRLHAEKVSLDGANSKMATPTAVLSTLNKLAKTSELHRQASDQGFDQIVPESPGYYRPMVEEAPNEFLNMQEPPTAMPEDLKGLSESMIRETLLEAGLSFDRNIVISAKIMLSNELQVHGITHEKMTIASEYANGIILATNIIGKGGKKSVEIPVEIVGKQILAPTTFISGAIAKNFDGSTLRAFADSTQEGELNALLSDKYDMSFKELYNSTLTSAARGNFMEVEESLSVIAEKFGPDFHKTAFTDLMQLVDIGFNQPVEKPLDEIEQYIKDATENIRHKEANIQMSKNLIYLYPKD